MRKRTIVALVTAIAGGAVLTGVIRERRQRKRVTTMMELIFQPTPAQAGRALQIDQAGWPTDISFHENGRDLLVQTYAGTVQLTSTVVENVPTFKIVGVTAHGETFAASELPEALRTPGLRYDDFCDAMGLFLDGRQALITNTDD